MSCELITFIVKGPITISQDRIARAKKHLEKMRLLAVEVFKVRSEDESDASLTKEDELVKQFAEQGGDFFEDEDINDALEAALHSSSLIPDFLDIWDGNAPDVNFRNFGHQRIIVTGDMSYGDEPEGSYQVFKQIYALGLDSHLGIE